MAYQALYRTYRPNHFNEVVGQEYIVTTLRNAVRRNKIAHAYLFCGPRGTGKTSIARILAKAVNCTGDCDDKPCNKCDSCQMIEAGTHPDIVEIDGASYGNVENTREIIDKVKYAPLVGKYKIYIIDEVHMLSNSAFNSLLKTLEEPPAHAIFILATTDPQKVLPTIVSRCQRFDFGKVRQEDIETRLKEILDKEKISYEEEAIREVSYLADGGMRDALSILDQVIAYAVDKVSLEAVYKIYGVTSPLTRYQLLKQIGSKDVTGTLNTAWSLNESGIDIRRMTNDLINIVKECLIYEATRDASFLKNIDEDHVQDLLSVIDAESLLKMIDILNEVRAQYKYVSDTYAAFEVALLKMSYATGREKPTENVPVTVKKAEPAIEEKKPEAEMITEPQQEKEKEITEQEPEVKTEGRKTETYSIEELLRLLVSADREKRMEVSSLWDNLNSFIFDERVTRYYQQLKNAPIGAVGRDFIVVHTKYGPAADIMNEANKDPIFLDTLKEALHQSYRIIAVTDDDYANLIAEFKTRQKNNTLPKPEAERIKQEKTEDAVEQKLNEIIGKGFYKVEE